MVQRGDFLKALGPNAAIVFAAWIFMGFLQQRYDSAINRYREMISDYRVNDNEESRAGTLRAQISPYRTRCSIMQWATLMGLFAAIFLILSLLFSGIDVMMPKVALINDAGTATLMLGFAVVIIAAALVIAEGRIVNRQLEAELNDIPDVKQS